VIKFVLILALVFVFSQILVRFARSIRATFTDGKGRKDVHVETPIGIFDLKSQEALDPALAGMLVYPGATRAEDQTAAYEADIHLLNRDYRILVATYWTMTPTDIVWDFYKRELPGWREKRQRGYGRSLFQEGPEGVRTVRVYTEGSGTNIETKISLNLKAAAATASSSGSRFGIPR